jgi:hypothetical protein
MVGSMINYAIRRKVVRGHGEKGRLLKAKLKTLEDPTIVTDVG